MAKDEMDERLEMVKDFVAEGRDLLDDVEPQIMAMEKEAISSGKVDEEILNTIFRMFHSLKGTASFLELQTIMGVTHEAETLLDIFRKGRAAVEPRHVDLLCRASDFIRNIIDTVERQLSDEGFEDGAEVIIGDLKKTITTISGELSMQGQCVEPAGGDAAGWPDEAASPPASLEEMQLLITPEMTKRFAEEALELCEEAEAALLALEKKPGDPECEAIIEKINGLARKCVPAEGPPASGPGSGQAPLAGEAVEKAEREQAKQLLPDRQQVIRVDIEKLDKLLDLVGELVIAEAMVANNQYSQGINAGRFEKALLQLDKITRDIQEVAMSMRMIPLAGTFRKMVRLVRDLAHKENKKVSLQIAGEETEVDKTIIEQISDPLVHIIRNAVDHGLESPGQRRAAGKPEAGQIRIEAKHSAGEVWIVVEDDGRGLDREKILEKGVERGLVKGEDRDMKDEDVWQLIFEPGFSTADKVSSISGRGVGMDVVRRNIEKLRGKVDIRSKPGVGTVFAVRIPLTLAIIEGMVVKVGQSRYTIPIVSIRESFRPGKDQITRTPDNMEIVRVRGDLLPVIRLHDLYRVQPRCRYLTEGILIVVENDDRKCCLFVDELIGQQQIVIKGLSSYLGQARGISGCAILGDGDISMILDISGLIRIAEQAAV